MTTKEDVVAALEGKAAIGDPINPGYYKRGGIELIDVIEDWGLEFSGAAHAAFTYTMRAGHKPGDTAEQDLQKAAWYLKRLRDRPGKLRVKGWRPEHDVRLDALSPYKPELIAELWERPEHTVRYFYGLGQVILSGGVVRQLSAPAEDFEDRRAERYAQVLLIDVEKGPGYICQWIPSRRP